MGNFIGNLYSNGEGVKQDYQEAVKWYKKSAEQGDAAACKLKKLEEKIATKKSERKKEYNWYSHSLSMLFQIIIQSILLWHVFL